MWRKIRQQIPQWQDILIISPTVAGSIILASYTVGLFQFLDWSVFDQFVQRRIAHLPEPVDSRIVVVTIDEDDLNNIGQWPIPEKNLTQLIANLKVYQPRAIGLDLYRKFPVDPDDQEWVKLMQTTPNLIGVKRAQNPPIQAPQGLPTQQVALADLIRDQDGTVRQGLLKIEASDNHPVQFSLATQVAWMYLETEGIEIKNLDRFKSRLGKGQVHRFQKNDEVYQFLLNLRGGIDSFKSISMSEVLNNEISPDLIRDRIVLIGVIAESGNVLLNTSSGELPGVFIHANITSQIVSTVLDGRTFIQIIPDSIEWLAILICSICGASLGANFVVSRRHRRWLTLLSIPLLSVILVYGSYLAFLWGWWIPIVPSGVAIFAAEILSILWLSYQKLEHYAQTLEEQVAERTQELKISEQKFVSIFHSTPTPITITVRQTEKHLLVNESFCELTGYQRNEVIGHTSNDFNLWVNQDARTEMLKILDVEGKVRNYEGDFRMKSGEIKTALLSAEIIDFGGEECLLSVGNDITKQKQAEKALRLEREKSEQLLLNILPEVIANRLKQDSSIIAEHFDQVTILFVDIVGFTPLSARLKPIELVTLLNKIFSIFDDLAEDLGLEKIKTIGDAYMVAAGLPIPREDHAEAIADMALTMQGIIEHLATEEGENLQIRIGINSGVVIAGVIGLKKFSYDLWGDTVNTASRMESLGKPGKIQVTEATYERLKGKYAFEKRGVVHVKGKGEMVTYWLQGREFK